MQINLSQYEQLKSEDAAGLSVSEAYFLKLDGVKYEEGAMYDIPSLPLEVVYRVTLFSNGATFCLMDCF